MPTCSKYVLDGWFILTYCTNVTYYIFNVLVLVSERQLTRGRPPRRRSRSSRRVAFHRSSTLCSLHTGLRCHLQYTHTHTVRICYWRVLHFEETEIAWDSPEWVLVHKIENRKTLWQKNTHINHLFPQNKKGLLRQNTWHFNIWSC